MAWQCAERRVGKSKTAGKLREGDGVISCKEDFAEWTGLEPALLDFMKVVYQYLTASSGSRIRYWDTRLL